MPLQKQIITFPFAKGLNEKASDKVTPAGDLTEAKNVVFEKAGQLRKRGGFDKQNNRGIAFSEASLGTTFTSANYVTEYGDEILAASQQRLFARTEEGLDGLYVDKGALVSCEVTNPFLLRNENYKFGPAHVAFGMASSSIAAFMLVTYVRVNLSANDNYQVIGEVRDAKTRNLLYEELIDTISIDQVGDDTLYRVPTPKAVVLGDFGYILYQSPQTSTATLVKFAGIDLSAPTDDESEDMKTDGFIKGTLPSFTLSYHRPMFDVDVCTAAGNATVAGESCHGSAAIIVGGLTGSNLNPSFTDATCDTTNTDATISMDSTALIRVGDAVSGTGIPAGAKVLSITDATNFELSANATATNSNQTLTFTRGVNESTANGTLKFEYFKSSQENLVQFGTPKVTTAFAVGNDGAGSSGNAESMPGLATNNATTSGFAIRAIEFNDPSSGLTAANGQIFYAVSNFKSSGTIKTQKFALIAHGLASETTLLNTASTGHLLRATAIPESSSIVRVLAELSDGTGGVKGAVPPEPDNHRVISFEMSRSVSGSSFSTEKVLGYNTSIASDLFNNGTNTYAVLSFLVGHRGSLSGNNLLMIAPPLTNADRPYEIVGAVGMGENSVTFTSDHQSSAENRLRLFAQVGRVHQPFTGTREYVFGTNRFSNIVEYVSTNNPGVSGTFEDEVHAPAVIDVNFDPERNHKSLTTPNGMLLTGGMLYHYDGFRIHENGFFGIPAFKTSVASAGGSLAEGSYLYRVVYEWYDDMGNVHRSGASPSQTVVAGGSNTSVATINVFVLQHTRKREGAFDDSKTGVRACIYRTVVGGSVYHKVGSINMSNQESSLVAEFKDYGGISDTELQDNELLYSQGGLPGNGFVGSCKDLCLHKERAFVTTSANAVRFSKFMANRDAVNFPDVFSLRVSSEKIAINCIEASREVLLLFTNSDGFYVAGDGPDNAGVGSYAQPRMFAPGLGAIAGADHSFFSGGTLIQTKRGIINVQPNLQLDYIGANIEDSIFGTTTNRKVLSIVVSEDTNEIRFLLENTASGSTSKILVYNTLFRQFTVHEISYSSTNSGINLFTQGAGNSLFLATADGNIHLSSPSKFTDNNTGSEVNIDMVVQTGFLNVAGLQAKQRVYRVMLLGKHIASHTLTLDVFTDYDDSTSATHTAALTGDTNPYHYRAHLAKQKCQAVKLKITISNASTEAVRLDGVAFEVGKRAGTFKLPAAQTLGAS